MQTPSIASLPRDREPSIAPTIAPSETSVGSQVSIDSVDPTSRVADEFESLVADYLEKLPENQGKGKRYFKRLWLIKTLLWNPATSSSSSSSPTTETTTCSPKEQCTNALRDFEDIITLWNEYRRDEKVTRRKLKGGRVERTVARLQMRGIEIGELPTALRLEADRTKAFQSDNLPLDKDKQRRYLVGLYGEMSYFLSKIVVEIKQRGYVPEIVDGFLREISQFETRLLEIIVGEGVDPALAAPQLPTGTPPDSPA